MVRAIAEDCIPVKIAEADAKRISATITSTKVNPA
jgi:hypothetical protein